MRVSAGVTSTLYSFLISRSICCCSTMEWDIASVCLLINNREERSRAERHQTINTKNTNWKTQLSDFGVFWKKDALQQPSSLSKRKSLKENQSFEIRRVHSSTTRRSRLLLLLLQLRANDTWFRVVREPCPITKHPLTQRNLLERSLAIGSSVTREDVERVALIIQY